MTSDFPDLIFTTMRLDFEELPDVLGAGATRCPLRGSEVSGGLPARVSFGWACHAAGREVGEDAGIGEEGFGAASTSFLWNAQYKGAVKWTRGSIFALRRRRIPHHADRHRGHSRGGRQEGKGRSDI